MICVYLQTGQRAQSPPTWEKNPRCECFVLFFLLKVEPLTSVYTVKLPFSECVSPQPLSAAHSTKGFQLK